MTATPSRVPRMLRRRRGRLRPRRHAARHHPRPRRGGQRAAGRARLSAAAQGGDPRPRRQGHAESRAPRARASPAASRPPRSTTTSVRRRSRATRRTTRRCWAARRGSIPACAKGSSGCRDGHAAGGDHQQGDALRPPASRPRRRSPAISTCWSAATTCRRRSPRPAPLLHVAARLGVRAGAAADGRRLGQRRAGGARGGLPGAGPALRLQRGRAGARARRRWYSRRRWSTSPSACVRRPADPMNLDLPSPPGLPPARVARPRRRWRRWRRC